MTNLRAYTAAIGMSLYALSLPAGSAILPNQVLVVYNSPSPDASAILATYLAAHPTLPSGTNENVFDLNDTTLSGVADVSYTDFKNKIRNPIRNYISTTGGPTPSSIIAIVLIRGIPHRIQDTDDATVGDTPNSQAAEFNAGDATAASVDAELVLLWQDLDNGEAGSTMDSYADNFILNPYVGQTSSIDNWSRNNITSSKSFSDDGNVWSATGGGPVRLTTGDLYLVCRLDGNSLSDVNSMIDRAQSLKVNRRYARVQFDEDSRVTQSIDDNDYEFTVDLLISDGWNVIYDDTADFITGLEQPRPLIGYSSYGENHGKGAGASTVPPGENPPGSGTYIDDFTFADGAIFSTGESYNGRAFNGLGTIISQEQVADFITVGGTFGMGSVWEPFSIGLPINYYLYGNFLITKLTWAEAAYSSIRYLSWTQVVIGDPLGQIALIVDQPGDFDVDLDVDLDDAAFLANCATGPTIIQADVTCEDGLLDADSDIDQSDFAIFQRCISGVDVSANPACAN